MIAIFLLAVSTLPSVGTARRARPRPVPPLPPVLPDSVEKTVKAWAALESGATLTRLTYSLPSSTPPAGYVDVAITHCGICHSDLHQIDDAWSVACFPLVPGHEIVGTIAAVGPDGATRATFKVGERAAIGVQRSCCGECAECVAHLENVCAKITKSAYSGF